MNVRGCVFYTRVRAYVLVHIRVPQVVYRYYTKHFGSVKSKLHAFFVFVNKRKININTKIQNIMKNLLFNWSFGAGSGPNQTNETQSREKRVGGIPYLFRTLILLIALLTIGVGQMWG